MPQPIRVDNERPATVRDTARVLGVSKKRTDELVRLFERTTYRDAKTGEFVIRAKKSGTIAKKDRSPNASGKGHKASSRRKA